MRIWKKSNVEDLFKKIQRYQKMHVFLIIGWSGFFLENPAPLSFLILCPLTSDQKSERSIAWLPRSGTVTHTHTIFSGYNSTRSWELQRSWRTNLTNGKTELDFFKLFDFYVFLTFSLVKFDSFGIIMFSKYETTRFHMVKNHHNLQYPSYSSTQNRKIGQKSKFWTFLRRIGHILHIHAI